jgi:hypothetical protein
MTKTNGKALEIARTYVEAIANRDVDTIISISGMSSARRPSDKRLVSNDSVPSTMASPG